MPYVPYHERLVAAFVELTDTLTTDFDIIAFLHTLTGHCVDLLDVRAAGVLLATPQGHIVDAAASDAATRRLELDSIEWDEGPCHDCFHSGDPATELSLDLPAARRRWPRFTPRATALGYRSVVASPLRLREQTIGALNLFRDTADPLPEPQLRLARGLADTAAISILQQRAALEQTAITAQLQEALNRRTTIEQAKGALAQHRQVSVDEAFTLLHEYARAHRQLLADLAREVIEGIADETLLAAQPARPPRSPEEDTSGST